MRNQKYFPVILHSRLVKECDVDNYHIELLTDVKCGGIIWCPHILIAYKEGETEPSYAIASEASSSFGTRTFFIGAYPGQGHLNYGSADEFGDLEVFEKKAVELMEKALNISINLIEK